MQNYCVTKARLTIVASVGNTADDGVVVAVSFDAVGFDAVGFDAACIKGGRGKRLRLAVAAHMPLVSRGLKVASQPSYAA